ncbi:MAG: PAS domain S-box protein [Polyangiaceae bacterium]|jgi:PAS domain S-box-containing protein
MKALLVGISAGSAAIVANVLGARGHERVAGHDGVRALEIVRGLKPALVVVEDPLADMRATEFCRRARACPEGVDAVILVITSQDDGLPDVLEAGATDLCTTSLGPAALEIRVLIAERLVRQQAQLRDREIRFRRLFESGVSGVTITDIDGHFKEANNAFLDMLGYTLDDVSAGKLNWKVITPPDRWVSDIEARAQLRSTGFLPVEERVYVHKTDDRSRPSSGRPRSRVRRSSLAMSPISRPENRPRKRSERRKPSTAFCSTPRRFRNFCSTPRRTDFWQRTTPPPFSTATRVTSSSK